MTNKFRVVDPNGGQIFDDFFINEDGNLSRRILIPYMGDEMRYCPETTNKIQWSTGFFDANNVEIYEGDKLQRKDGKSGESLWEVKRDKFGEWVASSPLMDCGFSHIFREDINIEFVVVRD